jgi:ribosomal protein S18 acetylase RimI-like enzyme
MLVQSMPGALGLAWPPRAESAATADALAAAGVGWFCERGVKIGQAFVPETEAASMASLARHGFQRVTQLISLSRPVSDEAVPSSLTFSTVEPPFRDEFHSVLLATDMETLDCPELDAGRSSEERLASLIDAASGATWFLARRAEELVGVVMITPGAVEGEIELAYLGVVLEARGYGLGRELAAFARGEAGRRGASWLTVSVDSRNFPALQLYLSSGFIKTGLRNVWLAHFSRSR